ncbi:MAG: phytanoyl-CoA dioxygenase family protein [Planctomycetes bacterium]|nr:phytanoyl-CoA dioxygenase family protein [Planctomycetota bacterium]
MTRTGKRGFSADELAFYREKGHVTVPGIFSAEEMEAAIQDIEAWGNEVLGRLNEAQKAWYLDRGVSNAQVLRKLDNPVYQRPVFRKMAGHPVLLACVEQILGPKPIVYFSQVFLKPPEGGSPKPVHQDNFYFGPNDLDGVVTAWLALDEATVENGCLYFGEGTNRGEVYPHVAPAGEPFNLQLPPEIAARFAMTPAPVPRGGVSFHHGNTFHQSSANRSTRWRRAAAFHYVAGDVRFVRPALPYDESVVVRI